MELGELLAKARQGDQKANHLLWSTLRQHLRKYAAQHQDRRLVARQDASDVVQDSLAEGFRDLHRFQGSTSGELCSYFQQIVRRNLADARRRHITSEKRGANREQPLDDACNKALRTNLVAPLPSPSQAAAAQELAARIQNHIQHLPQRQQEALRLAQLGYRTKEIARQLNCSPSAAESLLKHARDTLSTMVERS